jgi:putative endonuclease
MAVRSDPAGWKDPRHLKGLRGEEAAIEYLSSRGWTVLEHRYRVGRWEVDLVVKKGSLVAFVEVKTRKSEAFGGPFEAVGWRKQREMVRVARSWIDRHGRPGEVYRFDVIGVREDRWGRWRMEHLEDAFRPGWR